MAKIAVIDDLAVNRELLVSLVHAFGHASVEASNGAEALELVRREQPDLVICDILMPVMDGYEFVRYLRADPQISHIPVVFLTANYVELEAQQLARACGVTEILTKPYEPEQIIAVIERVLGSTSLPDVQAGQVLPSLPSFDHQHMRLMTDKLSEKVGELESSNKKLAALIELNLQLGSQRDAARLLDQVCNSARSLLGATHASIAVRSAENQNLAFVSHSGLAAEAIADFGQFQLDLGLLGSVVAERKSCRIARAESESSSLGLPAGYPPVRSLVAAPVVSLTAVYGWICLTDKLGAEEFSEDDEHLLGIVAAQTGRIYENGSLYRKIEKHSVELEKEIVEREQAQRRLAAQCAVARILAEAGAGNFEEACQQMLASICRDFGFAAGTLWRCSEDGRSVHCIDIWCQPEEECQSFVATTRHLTLAADVCLPGKVLASGSLVWVPDVTEDPTFNRKVQAAAAGLHAGAALPIGRRGERVSGVAEFFCRERREPNLGLIVMLEALGDQIGQFFERNQQQQRILRLTRVHAVLSGINSAIVRIHDRLELFREACRIAVEEGKFGMAWIGEVNSTRQAVVPVAWAGIGNDPGSQPVPLSGEPSENPNPVEQVIAQKEMLVINDLSVYAGVSSRMEEALNRGYHSVIILPLVNDELAAGVIVLYAGEADFFTDEEIALLRELADDVSFALAYIGKQDLLAYLAFYDALTGLPNRTLFNERLTQALQAARSNPGEKVCVVLYNINRFRNINDTFGQALGDHLLRELAQRLQSVWPDALNLARIPVDHFLGLISDTRDAIEVANDLNKAIVQVLVQPFLTGDHEIRVTMSAGIAVSPGDGDDADTLIRNAGAALRVAKQSGERYLFYQPEMNAQIAHNLSLENKLRIAPDRNEFVLHYQPKVSGATRKVTGLEALIRWNNPETGLVPPGDFIPLLEETGMILQVGLWAIRQALADARLWRAAGIEPPRIAVNVSALQLHQKDFVESVRKAIAADNGADPGIDLEITESMIVTDVEQNIDRLTAIREMGLTIAIDDFGTGYSSLGYLARLPVDALKIDQSFVRTMTTSSVSMTIVTTMIAMAHSLDLKVIAEGVEEEVQANFLALLKCDELQGYLISRPLPADRLLDFLRSH